MTTTTADEKTAAPVARKAVRGTADRPPYVVLTIVVVICIGAVLAPVLTSYSPTDGVLTDRLLAPFTQGADGGLHVFGTDQYGRDILTRIIYGSRVSLLVGFIGVMIAAVVGSTIGMGAALGGGRIEAFLMRIVDVSQSIPAILLAVLLAAALGPSLPVVFVAIGLQLWQDFARVVRGEAVSLRERNFVAMARLSGASPLKVALRHILPNVLPSVTVLITLDIGTAMITEASLSYLGVGVPPPAPSWGNMVSDGQGYMSQAWWLPVLPGAFLFLTVIAFNAIGDWTRLRLDPRLRESI